MRKYSSILLAICLLAGILFGCGQADTAKLDPEQSQKINIVCTIFPQYDWVREILGDQADGIDLTLLLNGKTDLHNYQPTADDIVKISNCDLFIYVGGESDAWVDDALAQAVNQDMAVVNLLEVLGDAAKEEQVLEGMEDEHEGHEEEGEAHEEEHGEAHGEYDEHIWLSLHNAQVLCKAIAEALITLAPEHAEVYQRNLSAYTAKLAALDGEYQTAVEAAPVKTLLFADRFPFRYLTDDYGIAYDAAFSGCSAETEASFDTVARLAKHLDEWNLHTVMVTESADQSIARTIVNSTKDKNQQILVLDSMQSVAFAEAESKTYISTMESNLNVLKDALK